MERVLRILILEDLPSDAELMVFGQQDIQPVQTPGIEFSLRVAGELFHFLIDKIHPAIHVAFIDHGREVVNQEAVFFLTFSEQRLGLAALPALLSLPEGPPDRGAQAG